MSDSVNRGSEGSQLPTAARRAARAAVEGSMWGLGLLLVVALVGILNYFGMKYYQRWDWTGSKLYSLSPKTVSVLGSLDRNVEATVFLQPSSNVYDAAKELLERYAAKSSHFKVRLVDPQRNLIEAKRLVDKLQLSSLSVVVFEAGEDRRVIEESSLADWDYSGMQYGAQPTMTGFKGEEAFTGAILELVEKRKPKVLFSTGHGERSLDDPEAQGLAKIRELLGKQNMDLESWASLGQKEIPAGTDLVVVAGPRVNFVEPELAAFSRYLDQGGRMLVLLDPELDKAGGVVHTGLEPWLAQRGVVAGDDLVVDPSATLPFYGAETIFVRATGAHPIVASLEQANYPVIFALSRSIKAGSAPAGLEAQTLLQTSGEGWGETDLAHLAAVAKGDKDTAGPVAVGVAVAAKSSATAPSEEDLDEEVPKPAPKPEDEAAKPKWRLVVFGDSDFAANGQLDNVGNPTLVSNAFNWLLERQKLLGIGPKKPEQVRLTLTPGQLKAIWMGTVLGLPALAIVSGFAVWRRRRR